MNSIQLKAKLRNVAKEKNMNFNSLIRLYMYDRFLERLSKSKYRDNFVLKCGFYLSTLFGVENRATMDIDIATGDPITPKEIRYKYLPLLGDYYIDLYAYNIETVLAEKIETMLNRLELNGRTRDFYDIYLIYKKEWKNMNIDYFRKAIDKAFTKREYKGDPFEGLDIIRNSEILKERWNKYQRNFEYAEGIEFEDIMNCLEKMIEQFETVVV